ncbi:class I SAM-dependent methyltransferase [Psychroserpens sp.]|uniref:class I SAM-dependent methyltransferase n=1 Tax=Psychroserpens sp. TaxID=2020870 RepID=UPI001B0175B2|nr:class I SAM-dependent methyltransferase [Psychroserpens sp.]MBO6607438.1 class I SAM-dependent methyltransferase [Psychroserpens sp.]MBO6632383.1 class I SAM-dependent methyltransferase [Psychroserpens sp.]MBO6654484.1 class I SAM-dependent methyltransferase [Psychroserpens sp.]MBO6681167.1 class I SAM-dependent methyltransferase [Psychroserpens sp.]MBO6749876.1 class I SAM-dependent methyltransferase [Psychroserpens sp.]
MLSKQDKQGLRGTIFRHLDGIATATSAYSLHKKGVLEYILKEKKVDLKVLSKEFEANEGYLNIALRILCSQGWLNQQLDTSNDSVHYETNAKSERAFALVPLYEEPVNLLKYLVKLAHEPIGIDAFTVLERIFSAFESKFDLDVSDENSIEFQIYKHIEGVIVAPIIVRLGMNGLFHKYFMEASFTAEEYHKNPESFKKILDFFWHLGWFNKKKNTYQFTDEGLFFAKRASAYGVTVSYLPTFIQLDELIFGNAMILKTSTPDETELHVHREMNVWGSGGAHSTYFKVIDEIIIKLFNKPIDEQPKGILDMGCGNGAFIQHIFDVIEYQTKRGKMLDDHPLLLVGADFNKAALKVTRANLIKADIWAKVIWGDIGRPDILANDLKEDYNIELKDLLNVRTFLDHNRIWESPQTQTDRTSDSSGAYASLGERLNNNLVEDSLLEHLNKWKPYVERFGLLLIELHTVNPNLVAQNIGETAATAYDATHGFSDQYILEVDVFQKIAHEAGLEPDMNYFAKFPNNDLATVSVNLLKGN